MEFLSRIAIDIASSLGALVLSAGVVWWLARRELIGKTFFSRVTFSYIALEGDDRTTIVLNTLLDERLSEVWLDNRVLRRAILRAAHRCDEKNPFVILPPGEMYHVKSGVRHQLSERFSDGIVDGALGFPVVKAELLACLCFTPSDSTGVRKLRAFVIRPDNLARIGQDPETFRAANAKKPGLVATVEAIHARWTAEKAEGDAEARVIHEVRIYRRS